MRVICNFYICLCVVFIYWGGTFFLYADGEKYSHFGPLKPDQKTDFEDSKKKESEEDEEKGPGDTKAQDKDKNKDSEWADLSEEERRARNAAWAEKYNAEMNGKRYRDPDKLDPNFNYEKNWDKTLEYCKDYNLKPEWMNPDVNYDGTNFKKILDYQDKISWDGNCGGWCESGVDKALRDMTGVLRERYEPEMVQEGTGFKTSTGQAMVNAGLYDIAYDGGKRMGVWDAATGTWEANPVAPIGQKIGNWDEQVGQWDTNPNSGYLFDVMEDGTGHIQILTPKQDGSGMHWISDRFQDQGDTEGRLFPTPSETAVYRYKGMDGLQDPLYRGEITIQDAAPPSYYGQNYYNQRTSSNTASSGGDGTNNSSANNGGQNSSAASTPRSSLSSIPFLPSLSSSIPSSKSESTSKKSSSSSKDSDVHRINASKVGTAFDVGQSGDWNGVWTAVDAKGVSHVVTSPTRVNDSKIIIPKSWGVSGYQSFYNANGIRVQLE